MIFLSILNDFCSWWVFWWIAPFILGIALGAAIWKKYKTKVDELTKVNERYKSSIYDMEAQLTKLRSDNEKCNADLSEATRLNKNLKSESEQLKKKALEQKVLSGLSHDKAKNRPNTNQIATTAASAGPSLGAQKGNRKKSFDTLQSTNLQVIEGIGPKIESILKESGINDWLALSKKSKGELRAILEKQGARYSIIDPSSWPLQARKAASAKWDSLIELQSQDGSESKLMRIMQKLNQI